MVQWTTKEWIVFPRKEKLSYQNSKEDKLLHHFIMQFKKSRCLDIETLKVQKVKSRHLLGAERTQLNVKS